MKFVYQPEGAEPRKWEFAPAKLMSPEAEAIERATKMAYGEWASSVGRGSMTALHALLWVMLKRENPTLLYHEVEFSLSDVTFEMEDEETAAALAELEGRIASGEVLEAPEVAALEALRVEAAKLDEVDEAPKDLHRVS